MAHLTDITFYDQYHHFQPTEGPDRFAYLAHYVSDLYVRCLHGYKPPRTSRISIMLVPEPQIPRAYWVGSIATLTLHAHAPTYNALPVSARMRFLLESLHEAVMHLCHAGSWDGKVFEQAYRQVLERDFSFCIAYPEKVSRDRQKRAYVLLEKTVTVTRLSACIDTGGKPIQATLYEGPNYYAYDPVYSLVNQGRWMTNDRFGVRRARPRFCAWYSLQQDAVGKE
jgi:hypothetical protein